MKYKCCDYLLHELVFAQNEVIPCCCAPRHEYETRFFTDFAEKTFDAKEYIKNRNKYTDIFKQGSVPKCCAGCDQIKEEDWDESLNIKRIIITNRTKCSCDCIYCSLITTDTQTKKELNTRRTYNIIPVLKDLRKQNLIKENCLITVAGGECTEYPKGELEYIIYYALQQKCRLEILSSGIIYSPTIEKALKTSETILKISPDSGKESTFEQIKRVKAFDNVWNNLKDYIEAAQQNDKAKVVIKYIILPDINDNIEEAQAFIEKCNSVNCKYIELAIEYLWFNKNRDIPPRKSIIDTVNCIRNSGMNITYEGQCIEYMKNMENNK